MYAWPRVQPDKKQSIKLRIEIGNKLICCCSCTYYWTYLINILIPNVHIAVPSWLVQCRCSLWIRSSSPAGRWASTRSRCPPWAHGWTQGHPAGKYVVVSRKNRLHVYVRTWSANRVLLRLCCLNCASSSLRRRRRSANSASASTHAPDTASIFIFKRISSACR